MGIIEVRDTEVLYLRIEDSTAGYSLSKAPKANYKPCDYKKLKKILQEFQTRWTKQLPLLAGTLIYGRSIHFFLTLPVNLKLTNKLHNIITKLSQ